MQPRVTAGSQAMAAGLDGAAGRQVQGPPPPRATLLQHVGSPPRWGRAGRHLPPVQTELVPGNPRAK